MGHDDREVGQVDRDVVEQDRVRQPEPDPAAPGHAGADAGLAGVEQGGDAVFRRDLEERVGTGTLLDGRVYAAIYFLRAKTELVF